MQALFGRLRTAWKCPILGQLLHADLQLRFVLMAAYFISYDSFTCLSVGGDSGHMVPCPDSSLILKQESECEKVRTYLLMEAALALARRKKKLKTNPLFVLLVDL